MAETCPNCQRKWIDHPGPILLCEEIGQLKAALKACRHAMRLQHGYTLRKFAAACGVSATRMSQWTADPVSGPPDVMRGT